MPKTITIEEIKAMCKTKTPFVYCIDGDEVEGIMAAFDVTIGFTCLATVSITKNGYNPEIPKGEEWCLLSYNPLSPNFIDAVKHVAIQVRDTGKYQAGSSKHAGIGDPICNFTS